MPETLEDRKEKMRSVLRAVQAQKSFEQFTFEEQRILKECYDAGYFEGLILLEMIAGNIVAEYRHEPRLTYKGMQFLDEQSQQHKGNEPDEADLAEGERDIGKQSLKWTKAGVIVAVIFGLIGIAVAVLDLGFF